MILIKRTSSNYEHIFIKDGSPMEFKGIRQAYTYLIRNRWNPDQIDHEISFLNTRAAHGLKCGRPKKTKLKPNKTTKQ